MSRWYPEVQRHNPVLAPDWRWQRAASLVSAGRRVSRKRDDEETCRAVAFLRHQSKVVTETASRRLVKRYPDIFLAIKLLHGSPMRRLEVECRILARQPTGLIAELLHVPAKLVRAYRTLFFAIDERIDASSYIVREVIGISATGAGSAEAWAKWAAYHHGPEMIEPWLDFLEHRHEAHDLSTLEGWRRDSIDLFLRAQNLQVDSIATKSALRFLVLTSDLKSIRLGRAVSSIFRQRMKLAMDAIPWQECDDDTRGTTPHPCEPDRETNSYGDVKIQPPEQRLRTA